MKNKLLKEITQVIFFTAVVFFSAYYFVPGVANAIDTINEGFKVFYGNYVDINNIQGNPCKRVLVGYTDSNKYFVPTKTQEEWNKFNENKPNSVGVVDCPVEPCTSSFNYMGQTLNGVYVGEPGDPNRQCWLVQNLNIGATTTGAWGTDNGIIEKRCYNDNTDNCNESNGSLYFFNEALNYPEYVQAEDDYLSDGLQGICPPGWHVPTDVEFNMMYQLQEVPTGLTCDQSRQYFPGLFLINFSISGYLDDSYNWYSNEDRYLTSSFADNGGVKGEPITAAFSPSNVAYYCYPVRTGNASGHVRCIKDSGVFAPSTGDTGGQTE